MNTAGRMLLERSAAGIRAAQDATDPGERYVTAHLAALRAAAAVLAVRRSQRGGPRSVWSLLPLVAPELNVWASDFASTGAVRARIEAGQTDAVSEGRAAGMLQAAERFRLLVGDMLGVPQQPIV